jgi:alkylation response protein AidB-like acyl-CoA dehydrogenase
VRDESGGWRLFGKKWFTSAITSQMALTLARPEGNGPGGSGLAMFYVETHDDEGRLNGIRVERLKDKLGTRKVPTAELTLDGARAVLVGDTRHGTRNIEPMLTVTRAWNSVTSVSFMRRAMALARAYASQRRACGAKLDQLPLHVDPLAGLEAETRGAFLLAFELVELIGRQEAGELDDAQKALLRLITPIAKLLTAKQAVNVVSECIEAFGGAGYVEDTGLPLLLRDTQVLPIWEGTTNVLALDTVLRGELSAGLPALRQRIQQGISAQREERLIQVGQQALAAVEHVSSWLSHNDDPRRLQANARRVAMTLGRALELALLVEHGDVAAAGRCATAPVDLLVDIKSEDSARLIE